MFGGASKWLVFIFGIPSIVFQERRWNAGNDENGDDGQLEKKKRI